MPKNIIFLLREVRLSLKEPSKVSAVLKTDQQKHEFGWVPLERGVAIFGQEVRVVSESSSVELIIYAALSGEVKKAGVAEVSLLHGGTSLPLRECPDPDALVLIDISEPSYRDYKDPYKDYSYKDFSL
jgi:hypothetical protein